MPRMLITPKLVIGVASVVTLLYFIMTLGMSERIAQ